MDDSGLRKENRGAVVIFFTRTAPQAASVAAARDFPARGGAAAPPSALIGPPVTALVCSNGNQGQLVFCEQHGAAVKERSFKSFPGWLKRVVFLPLSTLLSQKHSISRLPAHLTSQCSKNRPRRHQDAGRPPRRPGRVWASLTQKNEMMMMLCPAYTSKKEHLPVAAKTKDRQKSPPPVCMARGPSCSRSHSRSGRNSSGGKILTPV
ncbi:unnamed protein product [Prunus armeniaca]